MFKPLLIHNDNTTIDEICKNSIAFKLDSFDFGNSTIDKYISTIFLPLLQKKEFNILFIKDSLSNNYMELYGVLLAYHIRLSTELDEKRFIPIVILSELDGYILNKINPMSKILFTKNIFVSKNNQESFKYFEEVFEQITRLKDIEKDFLNLIEVKPPEDYLSHHSIANEWSIYRWSTFLNISNDTINANREKIENMIYFKYLQALYPANASDDIEIKKPIKEGKVLLIDDEWDKGWGDILSAALRHEELEFTIFKEEFRDKQGFDELNLNKINTMPDVVLLDLRLIAHDHQNDNIKDYSSMKILEKLHAFNPGIQVIMLTATGKSTILEKLYEKQILGYIKKEHPDDVSIDTVSNINRLIQLVDKGLDRKYLISVWKIQQTILEYQLFENLDPEIEADRKLLELKNSVSTIFATLNSNLPNTFVFGMLELYKCLEIINDYYIYEAYDSESKNMKAYWADNRTLINNDGNKSVNNKIRNILEKLSLATSTIHDIIDELSCSRNYQIHSHSIDRRCEGKIIYEINQSDILEWFRMINSIIEKINDEVQIK